MAKEIKLSTTVEELIADDLERMVALSPHANTSALLRFLIEDYLYGKSRALNLLKFPQQQKEKSGPF